MASSANIEFFESGTAVQFEWVFAQYQKALEAKAETKGGKAEALIKLDQWYQNELPKKIKSRGKEAHLTHEEIVMTIKWKLARGKFRPKLKDLITMNTPRVVMVETKKAFRQIFKKNDVEAAIGSLSNLKGVGPAMASAILAAGCPEVAPFMADELLLSMEGTEGVDYTMKEYMKLVGKTQSCVDRLNLHGGTWNPHKVELAVWTHFIARDLKPEILEGMPGKRDRLSSSFGEVGSNGDTPACDEPSVANTEASDVVAANVEASEVVAAAANGQADPAIAEPAVVCTEAFKPVSVANGDAFAVAADTAAVANGDVAAAANGDVATNGATVASAESVVTKGTEEPMNSDVVEQVAAKAHVETGINCHVDEQSSHEAANPEESVVVTAKRPLEVEGEVKEPKEAAGELTNMEPEAKRPRDEVTSPSPDMATENGSAATTTTGCPAVQPTAQLPIMSGGD